MRKHKKRSANAERQRRYRERQRNAVTAPVTDDADVTHELEDLRALRDELHEALGEAVDTVKALKSQYADTELAHTAALAGYKVQVSTLQAEIDRLKSEPIPPPQPALNGYANGNGYHEPEPQPPPVNFHELIERMNLLETRNDRLAKQVQVDRAKRAGSSWPTGGNRMSYLPASNPVPVPVQQEKVLPRNHTVREGLQFAVEQYKAKQNSGSRIL